MHAFNEAIYEDFVQNYDPNENPGSNIYDWFLYEYGLDSDAANLYISHKKDLQQKQEDDKRAWRPLTVQELINKLNEVQDKEMPVAVVWANAAYLEGISSVSIEEVAERQWFSRTFDRHHDKSTKVVLIK